MTSQQSDVAKKALNYDGLTVEITDRHASGLRAPGETRAIYKEEEEDDRTRFTVSLSTNIIKSWLRTLVVLGDQNRS
jgi:hypothetical protein